MKSVFRSIIVAALLGGSIASFNGCTNVMDVRNEGQLSTEAALSDAKAVGVAMAGAYNMLQATLGSGTPSAPSEALAGDITYAGSDFGYLEIWNQNMSLFTPQFRGLWENTYRGVNAVNNIITALPTVPDMTADQKRQYEGECKFLRGLMIFEAVRMWGHQPGFRQDDTQPGVILRTNPTRGTAGLQIGRSSVKDCYDQIIKDLKDAENLLADNKNDGRATKSAAQALLARVYLQRNDFANAYSYADQVIKSGKFSLNAAPRDAFYKSFTPEAIFQIAINNQNNTFGGLRGMYQKTAFGEPPFTVSADFTAFLATVPDADLRKTQFIKKQGNSQYCIKYDTVIMNINVIRLAEMHLIRAEAGIETGRPETEVLADLNVLRKRAQAPEDNSTSGKAALLTAIGNERRLELCFEGDRLHYLKRTKSTAIRGLAWNDNKLLAKIPDSEISGNPGIELNP
jgi:hypothetical protein